MTIYTKQNIKNMEMDITNKIDLLRDKMTRIETFFQDKYIPYYGEIIKLQIEEKIKNDRLDLILSMMNYSGNDNYQKELLNDKLDIYNIFYDCISKLGLSLYEQISQTNTRCL